MFDLEREVATWSAAVHAERCQPAAGVAELTDHLYCEIERARAEGLSDEEAFGATVARVGAPSDLKAEHGKNRSALGTVCQVAAKLDGRPVRSEHRRLLIAHAVIWAALIIASALLLPKTASEAGSWLLTVIFIPLWLASDGLLRSALRHKSAGRA